jgi:hypothetical protein
MEAKAGIPDASHLYEVEYRAQHAARPGFRIFLQDPEEEVRLASGQTFTARAKRPHLVTNGGESSVSFLVLQGVGEYDYVPLVTPK